MPLPRLLPHRQADCRSGSARPTRRASSTATSSPTTSSSAARRAGSGVAQDFVKILDFGIAKVARRRIAPDAGREHLRHAPVHVARAGGGAAVDHRTDIYALGIILYEMASGKVPFDADNFMGDPDAAHSQGRSSPSSTSFLRPTSRAGFDAVIQKCLRKKVEERYASMHELIADLERLEMGASPAAPLEPASTAVLPLYRAPVRADSGPAAGGEFGKYVVARRLGVGGMAEVFLCRLAGIGGFDKSVVVKRILPRLVDDPNLVQMFLDEARITANLNHPSIVQVFEIDQVDQIPYMAMEYVRGPSLSQVLKAARRAKALHFGHAAHVMSAVAAGLHHAHTARDSHGDLLQIVHRDLSPQNILVSLEGVTKVLDFGVARARGRLATTQAGVLKGKARYIAPEQVLGQDFDHRADVFSMGVCLYLATTGQHPFDGESDAETLKAAVAGDFALPSSLVDGYPPELEAIVLGMLETDPDARTPTAGAVHDQLEEFLRGREYPSSTNAVATWVGELFPDFNEQQDAAAQAGTASTSGPSVTGVTPSASRSGSGATPSSRGAAPATPPSVAAAPGQSRSGRMWRSVALVGGGMVGALVIAGVLPAASGHSPPVQAPPQLQTASPPPPKPGTTEAPAALTAEVPATTPARPQPSADVALSGVQSKPAPRQARKAATPPAARATAATASASAGRGPCADWTPDSPLPPCSR